jgi:hypothetical protein
MTWWLKSIHNFGRNKNRSFFFFSYIKNFRYKHACTYISWLHVLFLLVKCVKIECWWGVENLEKKKLSSVSHTNYDIVVCVRRTVWHRKQSTHMFISIIDATKQWSWNIWLTCCVFLINNSIYIYIWEKGGA